LLLRDVNYFVPVLICFAMAVARVLARLPPLTPEQQSAAEQKKAEEAEKARAEQEALTRVQDRIAAQFGRKGAGASSGQTQQGNLSQKSVEPAGTAGPTGGTAQSAEAHSTPAR
jgi:hypothetical protein